MQVITLPISVTTPGPGLHDITARVQAAVNRSALREGLCTVFVRHTSASLLIQENADPSVRADLQAWLARLVPEHDPLYTHNEEGPDDMPAHVKAALTQVSLQVPLQGGSLALGRWQGVYLWEHRAGAHERSLLVTIIGTRAPSG
ncbi:MAG TPA: secondary thiamine-phosphate synthase enzyme YjbQ [Phycisphaerales bacterium]|nr:secondary thiamine-phosphate synthase enzyme YjbQ [Phycisphaerales bacterium]